VKWVNSIASAWAVSKLHSTSFFAGVAVNPNPTTGSEMWLLEKSQPGVLVSTYENTLVSVQEGVVYYSRAWGCQRLTE